MAEFIEEVITDEWEVETPTGYQSFSGIGKTKEYTKWIIKTANRELVCADYHIVIRRDLDDPTCLMEVYTCDLQVGDMIFCEGDAFEEVLSVEETNESDNMYDLIDVEDGNLYYTNGIVSHNSTTTMSWALHQLLFNPNISIAVLANKQTTAKNLLNMIKNSFEHLPKWMQQGVVEWNKHSIQLENGSKVTVASTSSSSARGGTHNVVILDEFAFVPANLAEDFFSSVFPTISAGTNTKLVVISTPNGLNLFYKMWMDSVNNRNTYVRVEAKWNEVPGRDEEFKKQIMANFAGNKEARWSAEFEVEFLGSDNTLLSPSALASLVYNEPVMKTTDGFKIYEPPIEKHLYTICVDPSQGIDLDYHAVTVIDCTKFPYKVVAVYRNNQLSPQLLSNIIHKIAKQYNNAYTLIENNDPTGDSIATSLVEELEYEHLIYVSCSTQKHGQKADGGFSGRSRKGVKMSYQIKNYGCSVLKDFIENRKIIVNDFDIVSEFSTFVKTKNTYAASEGNHDDVVMSLVVFCWLTSQPFFQEYTSTDVKKRLFEDKIKKAEDDITLFGFLEDGVDDITSRMFEEDNRSFEQWLAEEETPNKPKSKKMDFEW
jgi:hypothetical protein